MSGSIDQERANLDKYLRQLAEVGEGLTANDFREGAIQRAIRSERAAKYTLYASGLIFMGAIIYQFMSMEDLKPFTLILIWVLSLGGLGAVAHIMLTVLKLTQQEAPQRLEELDVVARIFLGCLFSLVLSLALIPQPLREFFHLIAADEAVPRGGATATQRANVLILLPFLCGYSIRLVLGILTKAILAVEMTLGLNELKPLKRGRPRRHSAS